MNGSINNKIAVLAIGVFIMFQLNGCSVDSPRSYDSYSATDQRINISTRYPKGWIVKEDHGSKGSYSQSIFIEPRDKGKTDLTSAMMVVTVKPAEKLKFATAKEYADDLISKKKRAKDFVVVSRSTKTFLGRDAVDIVATYKMIDKLYSADAKFFPAKEQILVTKRNDKFYIIRYKTSEEKFQKFHKAFDYLVDNLKIRE